MFSETVHYGVEQIQCEKCERVNHGPVTGKPDVNVFAWECSVCGHTQEV